MKSKISGCQDIFFWTSSVIGFIVDTIALVSLIAGREIAGLPFSGSPAVPEISICAVVISWMDITGAVLIYVGIAFAIISIRIFITRHVLILTSYFSHFFAALILLWIVLFFPLTNISLYLRIAEAWLIGLFILVILHMWRFDLTDEGSLWKNFFKFPVACIVALVVFLPGWTFFEMWFGNLPWWWAVLSSFRWSFLGIMGSVTIWGGSCMLVGVVGLAIRNLLKSDV